jgi:hypothetical protein
MCLENDKGSMVNSIILVHDSKGYTYACIFRVDTATHIYSVQEHTVATLDTVIKPWEND